MKQNESVWRAQAAEAIAAREADMKHVGRMRIYDLDAKKCSCARSFHTMLMTHCGTSVPNQKQIKLRLNEQESGEAVGHADWLVRGMQIQEEQ